MNKGDNKKRILVVDDEPGLTRLVKLNLEKTGAYEVRTVNESRAAVTAAEEFQPDLILLDVMMPGIDGGELANHFQASPKCRRVPIVFLTAAARREEVQERGGVIGGVPFLARPVDVSEIVSCLQQHLGT